jgi:adenylate kinase family enzyme
MEKIAIIGSPGAGKTTLARNLNRILKIKVYHLDRLFWKSGWQSIDGPTRIDTMQNLIREKQWIIEGTYLYSSVPRLDEADTIIFLDMQVFACLWRVIKRHLQDRGKFRRDIPEQSVDKLNPHRIYKLLVFPIRDRKQLTQKLRTYEAIESKEIIRLQSKKDLKNFLERLGQNAMANTRKGRSLATVR